MADKADEKAKENRLRVFRAEGAQALEDVANEAIAIRKNMARLRELRLAKEAAAIREQIAAGNVPKGKKAISADEGGWAFCAPLCTVARCRSRPHRSSNFAHLAVQ